MMRWLCDGGDFIRSDAMKTARGGTDGVRTQHNSQRHVRCLSMTMDQYLRLLDWTGRQIRADKVGAIPKDYAPILERLELNAETWLDVVKNFCKRFHNEAGLSKSRQSFRSIRRHSRSSSTASS